MYAPSVMRFDGHVRNDSRLGETQHLANKRSRRMPMNWEQVEGKWKQYAGQLKEKWARLTDDDLQQIGAKREQLAGKIQERYGILKEEAERQINEFLASFKGDSKTAEKKSKTHGTGR
jgi:uncharacterized protein YjbJ (UPF0337 family)